MNFPEFYNSGLVSWKLTGIVEIETRGEILLRLPRVRSFGLCLSNIYIKSLKSQHGSKKNALKVFSNLLNLSVKDPRDYS